MAHPPYHRTCHLVAPLTHMKAIGSRETNCRQIWVGGWAHQVAYVMSAERVGGLPCIVFARRVGSLLLSCLMLSMTFHVSWREGSNILASYIGRKVKCSSDFIFYKHSKYNSFKEAINKIKVILNEIL